MYIAPYVLLQNVNMGCMHLFWRGVNDVVWPTSMSLLLMITFMVTILRLPFYSWVHSLACRPQWVCFNSRFHWLHVASMSSLCNIFYAVLYFLYSDIRYFIILHKSFITILLIYYLTWNFLLYASLTLILTCRECW